MNILFLTLGHVSKLRGGVDRVTDTLAQNLIYRGHNVYMISVWKSVPGDKVESYQYFFPSLNIDSKENVEYLKKFIGTEQVDVIVNQSEPTRLMDLLVAAHGTIPIVTAIHTDPKAMLKATADAWDRWKLLNGRFKFLIKSPYYLLRLLYQRKNRKDFVRNKYSYYYEQSSAVVLLSARFKDSFKDISEIKEDSKLYAISNPMSTDILENHCNKEKLILFVGRLDYSPKRLDRLLKIWSGIKDKSGWKLCVLGDGPGRNVYETLAKQLGLDDVVFFGTVDPTPYYEKASILCVTSTYEGFSMVILEGLYHGVIPVAFDSYEAVYDLIEPGYNGYIVPSFSLKEYKRSLERLMNNYDLRKSMRKNIMEKNNRLEFEVNSIAGQWINLFEKTCNKTNN